MEAASEIAVSDPVRFKFGTGFVEGHVAKKNRRHCVVVASDGRSFNVPWNLLSKRAGAEPKRVSTRTDDLKAQFVAGEEVEFASRIGPMRGTIARLNPKSAHVVCDEDGKAREYLVPYPLLTKMQSDANSARAQILEDVARQAEQIFAKHGLQGWSFQYDDASRRAGCCFYGTKVITLARQYCLEASEAERTNTLLHEIAHALVGPEHHHDAVWKRQARAIGCTGERCHNVEFAPPRYIVSCPNCKWGQKRNLRKRRLVCKKCRAPLQYETFTAERWKAYERDRSKP